MLIHTVTKTFTTRAVALPVIGTLTATLLTGCYVVPITQPVPDTARSQAAPHAQVVKLSARLYPANKLASRHGIVSADISHDYQGRGVFNAYISGEQFRGEATRTKGRRGGIAHGAGNHGNFIKCTYTMNSNTQGTGSCQLNNGAAFNMHVGA